MSGEEDDTEPSEADVIRMANHPLRGVWAAAVDAVTSPDFRLSDGSLNEAAYVRYALRTMDHVLAAIVPVTDGPLATRGATTVDSSNE